MSHEWHDSGKHELCNVLYPSAVHTVSHHCGRPSSPPAEAEANYDRQLASQLTAIADQTASAESGAIHSAGVPACVINVSSHAGVRPKGASIPYAATKAALNHVTRLLALSLAPDIRVNAVAPGLVDTPLTADWTQAQDLWRERAPMRRAASPQDIAQAVSMLIASNYLTGEILLSDGGLNLT